MMQLIRRHTQVASAVGAFLFGLLAMLLYAWKGGGFRPGVLASSIIFSLAATVSGAFFGFLFGVPRTVTSEDSSAAQPNRAGLLGVQANTNLEQISDWLTKVVVGITLTQLGEIPSGAARLFGMMAPSLGGEPDGAVFAGGLVIYFSLLGFLAGWLFTRLYLGRAMSKADERVVRETLEQALQKASAQGETEKVQALERALLLW